eukprot:Clim_evm7s90 gene=Clim_evmTU7s90
MAPPEAGIMCETADRHGHRTTTCNMQHTTRSGTKMNERYQFLGQIAAGSSSTVFLAEEVVGHRLVAIKVMTNTPGHLVLYKTEIKMLQRIQGIKGCVQMLAHYQENNHLFIVMEYLNNGDFFSKIDPDTGMSEYEAITMLRRITEALRLLHSSGYSHGDVKPENIGVDQDGNVKLIDFGFSRHVSDEKSETVLGTRAYLAPEGMLGFTPTDSRPGDVWALGVTFFAMLTSSFPWERASPNSPHYSRFLEGDLSFAPWTEINDTCLRLVLAMLETHPRRRITTDGILAYLDEHFAHISSGERQAYKVRGQSVDYNRRGSEASSTVSTMEYF